MTESWLSRPRLFKHVWWRVSLGIALAAGLAATLAVSLPHTKQASAGEVTFQDVAEGTRQAVTAARAEQLAAEALGSELMVTSALGPSKLALSSVVAGSRGADGRARWVVSNYDIVGQTSDEHPAGVEVWQFNDALSFVPREDATDTADVKGSTVSIVPADNPVGGLIYIVEGPGHPRLKIRPYPDTIAAKQDVLVMIAQILP